MMRDDAVIELLKKNNSLLDSELTAIAITRNEFGNVQVQLDFELPLKSEFSTVSLKFLDVIEFDFGWDNKFVFVNVGELKFLKLKDYSYYLALDPDPSTTPAAGVTDEHDSDTDNFFVRAQHVEAEATRKAGS
jgi:hypothetical protein